MTKDQIKTASDLRAFVEGCNENSKFFSRENMRGAGDTMKNYGVRRATIDTHSGDGVEVFELYRRRAVKHGLRDSAYFRADTFAQTFQKQGV